MYVRIPPDVPVHREPVGAMGVALGSQMPAYVTVPYVYRGKGYDMAEGPPEVKVAKVKAKAKRRKRRKAKPRVYYSAPRYEPQPPPPPPPPLPPPPPPPAPKIRPAPGWAPMTGADFDDLLKESEG